ncbi:MAG: hypothetical protein ABUT20_30770, partial [Bacteroidota bacterium]
FLFLFFSGCIALNFISSWLVLFMPLNFYVSLVITFLIALYLIFFQRNQVVLIFNNAGKISKISFTEYLYLSISLLLFLLLGSLKPVNSDTQIYHLQIIKWVSSYGIVPGIANLSPRFGLGSGWFNLISLLHIPFFKIENYSFLDTSFVSCFFLWLFHKYKFYRNENSSHSSSLSLYYFILFLYFMLDWQLFRDAANSTNYDFPVTAFIIIVISCLLEEIIIRKTDEPFSHLPILFSLTIISFKFSGIFILFPIGYYILQKKKLIYLLTSAAVGFFLLTPVLIKNYVVTGFPFYPYPLSIYKPDWQLPSALTEGIYRYILNSNRFYNFPFSAEPMENSPFYWIPFWYKGILTQHKILFFTTLASIFILSFTKPISGINYKQLRRLLIFIFLMLAGWFFSAPDPGRFGYGILLPVTFFTLAICTYKLFNPFFYTGILFCFSAGLIYYTYNRIPPMKKKPNYFFVPIEGDKPSYNTYFVNGVGIHIPEIINGNWNRRCYDIVLPCSCEENPYLQPRGKSLKDGFRMNPYPDSSFIKNYIY